ncbi:MAG: hypothetical protein ACTHXI_07885 [Halomonadaceae bacterium]|nr:hypothetical protein [Halomonas sp.]
MDKATAHERANVLSGTLRKDAMAEELLVEDLFVKDMVSLLG